ncbi:MAG TPA: sigma 54-interacting transcriptional regulator [Phycisphaerae bacterium]|nr:sigma 54-interacting transcriptional regulator [Phycisphaerae bacterium]HUT61405.1 sigma 54-interacting transcriptional regulator [Phycisphaerae bacterium]
MVSSIELPPEALSALVDASAAINAAQGLDETFRAIAGAAAAVMKAEAASVIILDDARDKQVFRAAVGDRADQLLGVEYDRDLGVSGKVARTGQAMIVNDVTKERSHYKDIDALVAFQTRSLIAAPLTHKGQTLGVVEIINPLHRERFDEGDMGLCRLFANLAAIAAANAQLYDRLKRDNRGLKHALHGQDKMLGDSPAMAQVKSMIRRVAASATTVLLQGPTGTGKELAARAIHNSSVRGERPFIAVNCAALPETLLESELFGHEAGSFTGAAGRKLGRFELADGGTIFLDEIGEVAPSIQVKLLRVIQEKEIVRVGGTRTIGCDVRIISATNRDLAAEMRSGRFREDLYYRLNVFPIEIPALRDRREDIPLLAQHFVQRLAADMKHTAPEISQEAMAALMRYGYPGNIRELQNILERACLLCCMGEPADDHVLRVEHLPRELATGPTDGETAGSALASSEKAMVINALRENAWNQTRTAKALGITRDNLRYRIKKHDIQIPARGKARGPKDQPQAGG